MKKEVIALGLALVLCLGLMAGCGKKNEDSVPEDATPEDVSEPANPADAPAEPDEQPTEPAEPDVKTFEISMEGETVPVEMTKQSLDMGADGVSLEIYVDTALYKLTEFEGEHYIGAIETAEPEELPATNIHLYYVSGKTADILAEEALQGRRDGSTVTDGGMVKLGDYDAYLVEYTGMDYSYYENLYFITGENGTVCISVHLDEDNLEGHGPRFEAMLNTLSIVKA